MSYIFGFITTWQSPRHFYDLIQLCHAATRIVTKLYSNKLQTAIANTCNVPLFDRDRKCINEMNDIYPRCDSRSDRRAIKRGVLRITFSHRFVFSQKSVSIHSSHSYIVHGKKMKDEFSLSRKNARWFYTFICGAVTDPRTLFILFPCT